TSPASGSSYSAGSTMSMTASASSSKGITLVQWLFNGEIICSPTAAPYACDYQLPTTLGQHTLVARAVDSNNTHLDSKPVVISIVSGGGNTPVPAPAPTDPAPAPVKPEPAEPAPAPSMTPAPLKPAPTPAPAPRHRKRRR
ncbi:MAG: hypothetical protein H7333_09965, partial [Bdellovibrionales bacterium]|nr:hypothetical protein [Oligoflexia bacterium]